MAVPDSELPGKGRRPLPVPQPGPSTPANRPIPAGASNRPIPVARKTALPEADDDDDYEDEEDTDLKEALRNAPAWLVSTVFHMLLLIVLGLLVYSTQATKTNLQVEVSTADPGEQLEDPSVLESSATEIDTMPEQIITPNDLVPVDDPLAAPPELAAIDLPLAPTVPAAVSSIDAPIGLALKGREKGSKQVLLKKYGGTAQTEASVVAALEWLVRQQRADGSWSLAGPYSDGATSENVAAATAMALLAFQGYGDTHQSGKYARVISRGWAALLKMQRPEGLFSGQMAMRSQMLYTHAQATIAVCELYGMTRDSRFREPAQRAINYCVEAQDRTGGGWRYEPRRETDTSVTGWFVMALQSARMAGLQVPGDVLERVSAYLDRAALDDGRRYGYQEKSQPTNALAAEGLFCRQYLGWAQDDVRLVEGISQLVQTSPVSFEDNAEQDVYYWYYATQAAHHMEGKIWNDWNQVMRKELPAVQVKQGPEAGSWEPRADKWGTFNGRLYVTCLSVYILEVYYRHLPIYAGYKAFEALPDIEPAEPEPTADTESPPAASAEGAAGDRAKPVDGADQPPVDADPAPPPRQPGDKPQRPS